MFSTVDVTLTLVDLRVKFEFERSSSICISLGNDLDRLYFQGKSVYPLI